MKYSAAKSSRGFTLIELLVVISIISLIASVVLASLNTARERGRIGGGQHFASQVDHIAGEQAVAIWDLDECTGSTTADRSGFGNVGTVTGAWSTDTPTGKGCSLSFSGSPQYVGAGNGTYLAQWTLSAWIKPTSSSGNRTVIARSSGGSTRNYMMYIEVGSNRLTVNYTSPSGVYKGSTSIAVIPLDKWTQVVGTYDGNAITIYINGIRDNSSVVTGAPDDANGLSIGRNGSAASEWFVGLIDAPKVFAKPLTAFEVGNLYAAEKAKFDFASR